MSRFITKPVALNLTFILLFTLFTSGFLWSFYLQKENNQNIDRFYRSTNWYANRMLYQSEKFLYQTKLYELHATELNDLKLSYDLVWNRLQLFLEANSTDLLRCKHPDVTEDVRTLFNTIRSMEVFFDHPEMIGNAEYQTKVADVKSDLLNLNYSLSKVLSGTISQGIRTNNDLIQYWQFVVFFITTILAFILFRLSRRASKLAELDPLTQLGNRRALTEHLRHQIRHKKPITLCAIDLKRFKQINDNIGYQIGDKVLVEFAHKLTTYPKSVAYRLGGDEFVLMISQVANQATVMNWIQELKQHIEFTYQTHEHQVAVTTRLGIAFMDASLGNNHQIEAKALLEQAIQALNETKQNSDKDYAFFSEAIDRIEQDQEKRQLIHQWLQEPNTPCPLMIRTQPMFNPESQENEFVSIYFNWKHDNSLCSIEWFIEHRIYSLAMPKLLEIAYQQESKPILLRLSSPYQLEQLLKAMPTSLLEKEFVFGLPQMMKLDAHLIELICSLNICIALENAITDHLIEKAIFEHVRFWTPNYLPDTYTKQQALFELARAYNKTILLPGNLIKQRAKLTV